MDALDDLLMFLGSSVCHQLVDRSYLFGDTQMPLCARCIGIHLGFLVSVVFLWVGRRRFSCSLPSRNSLIVLGAIMSVAFIDAGLSYSEIWESDNLRRTLSGLALGIPLPFVLVPLLNLTVFQGRGEGHLMGRRTDWLWLALLYLLGAGAILLSESAYPLFLAVSIAGVIGVFALFTSVILVILSLSLEGKGYRSPTRMTASILLAVSVLMILAVVHGEYFPRA